jgi:hypothetical protein
LQKLLRGSNQIRKSSDEWRFQMNTNHDLTTKIKDGVNNLTEILQLLFYPNEVHESRSSFYEGLLSISICRMLNFTKINYIDGIVEEVEKKIIPHNKLEEYRLSKKLIIKSSKVYDLYKTLKSYNTSSMQKGIKRYEKDSDFNFSTDIRRCKVNLNMAIPALQQTYYKLKTEHNSPTLNLKLFEEITSLVVQVNLGFVAEEIQTSTNYLQEIQNGQGLELKDE